VKKAGASLQAASLGSSGSADDSSSSSSSSSSPPVSTTAAVCLSTTSTRQAALTVSSGSSPAVPSTATTTDAVRNARNELRKSASLADVDVSYSTTSERFFIRKLSHEIYSVTVLIGRNTDLARPPVRLFFCLSVSCTLRT